MTVILSQREKRYQDQNFLGTFSPPTFSFTFPVHSSQDSFLCTFLELEGMAHEPDLLRNYYKGKVSRLTMSPRRLSP